MTAPPGQIDLNRFSMERYEYISLRSTEARACLWRYTDVITFVFQVQSNCEIQDGLLLVLPSSGFCNVPRECVWTVVAWKSTRLLTFCERVTWPQFISHNLRNLMLCRQGLAVRRSIAMPNTSCWRWESSFRYRYLPTWCRLSVEWPSPC